MWLNMCEILLALRRYYFGIVNVVSFAAHDFSRVPVFCLVFSFYPCERRAFVFELGFLGVAILCPSTVALRCCSLGFLLILGVYL